MASQKTALTGQLSDADLRLLRIYRKVVECGGFSSAITHKGAPLNLVLESYLEELGQLVKK